MIRYDPSYIVAYANRSKFDAKQPRDLLPLYEHLARKLLALKDVPYEVLEDTSGINSSGFPSFSTPQQVETTLAKVFLAVGTPWGRGAFLRRIGIRKWADLAKPIVVEGRQSKAWPHEGYDVAERRLKEPGPNEYHPKAVYGQSCAYQFRSWTRRWQFVLHYGYSRTFDSHSCRSSWQIEVCQGKEALSTFVNKTVPAWIDSVLEPEDGWSNYRTYSNRNHAEVSAAVERLFAEDWSDKASTVDALVKLMHVDDSHVPSKLALTRRRLTALRRWKRADEAKEAARQAALKKETPR